MSQLKCDNYVSCRSAVPEQASETATQMLALARGWHLWAGETLGGRWGRVTLCKVCVGAHRRPERPAPEHLAQDPLFP